MSSSPCLFLDREQYFCQWLFVIVKKWPLEIRVDMIQDSALLDNDYVTIESESPTSDYILQHTLT